VKLLIPALLLLLGLWDAGAQTANKKQDRPQFMGRKVTIIEPKIDANGFPKDPVSVCVDGPPQRQCYTAPEGFGRIPMVEVIQVDRDTPALFFSAESTGGSGWQIHFALLRPGTGGDLLDLLNEKASNQSQHAFWTDSTISDAAIFVTANFVWGPDEAHYDKHRYIISAFVRQPSIIGDPYYLADQYMTVRKYDLDKDDILASEKPEILARLRRVKAANSKTR
jgi:hypothetical protein